MEYHRDVYRLGWLPVKYRVDQIKLVHMYKIINGLSPCYMSVHIEHTTDRHNYNTRFSQSSLVIPKIYGKNYTTFYYTGIKLWNQLSTCTKNKGSLAQFKYAVKTELGDKIVI